MKSKNIVETNSLEWDKLKIHDMHLDVNLARCQKYLFPEAAGKKLLYIGFGEGENLSYLISAGFDCYGTEIAKSRLDFARRKLKKRKQSAILKLVDSNLLPFGDGFFDIVLCWESLYYNNEKTLTESLNEIFRVLKPGGCFLSSMVSRKHKLLCHEEVAPSVFHPAPGTGQSRCMIFCLKDRRQIKNIYNGFKKIKIGYYSSYLFKSSNFHYVIYCEK